MDARFSLVEREAGNVDNFQVGVQLVDRLHDFPVGSPISLRSPTEQYDPSSVGKHLQRGTNGLRIVQGEDNSSRARNRSGIRPAFFVDQYQQEGRSRPIPISQFLAETGRGRSDCYDGVEVHSTVLEGDPLANSCRIVFRFGGNGADILHRNVYATRIRGFQTLFYSLQEDYTSRT